MNHSIIANTKKIMQPAINISEDARHELHKRLLSSVSHDLKTPLATVIGSLEIFKRIHAQLTPEKRDALIHSALIEAYRLDSFITNILEMAKLEEGTITAKPELVDINSLLQDCISHQQLTAGSRKIIILSEGETIKNIYVDPLLLSRSISLILENAIRYGREGSVFITNILQGGKLRIVIRDHGPGLPPGMEEKIFNKYTRYAHTDYQNAGTGLGLPATRLILQLLGASIFAETVPNSGAQFTITFPSILLQE